MRNCVPLACLAVMPNRLDIEGNEHRSASYQPLSYGKLHARGAYHDQCRDSVVVISLCQISAARLPTTASMERTTHLDWLAAIVFPFNFFSSPHSMMGKVLSTCRPWVTLTGGIYVCSPGRVDFVFGNQRRKSTRPGEQTPLVSNQ